MICHVACVCVCVCIASGPICAQHLGVWEDHVSHQSFCAVLLSARVHSHPHRHRSGPAAGESGHEAPLSSKSIMMSHSIIYCYYLFQGHFLKGNVKRVKRAMKQYKETRKYPARRKIQQNIFKSNINSLIVSFQGLHVLCYTLLLTRTPLTKIFFSKKYFVLLQQRRLACHLAC